MALNFKRATELLEYASDTGVLRWRVDRKNGNCVRKRAGDVAGFIRSNGYLYVGIDGKSYLAHRLAWMLTHGSMPGSQIDHKNGDRSDNRLDNLRLADGKQQNANQTVLRSDNSSGYRGVSYSKARNKWVSWIRMNGKNRYLGQYDSPESAYDAYRKAATDYFGEEYFADLQS